MKSISEALYAYLQTHPFDSGDPDSTTVLDQLYHAYTDSHESDPPDITALFRELSAHLETLPLETNNSIFRLTCDLYIAYERKAFLDGLQYGAELILELKNGYLKSERSQH
jgi:hypothetical protein